jgi:hypothetical protein
MSFPFFRYTFLRRLTTGVLPAAAFGLPDGDDIFSSGKGAKNVGRFTCRPDFVCLAMGTMSSEESSEPESPALISSSLPRTRFRFLERALDLTGVLRTADFNGVNWSASNGEIGWGAGTTADDDGSCSSTTDDSAKGKLSGFGARLMKAVAGTGLGWSGVLNSCAASIGAFSAAAAAWLREGAGTKGRGAIFLLRKTGIGGPGNEDALSGPEFQDEFPVTVAGESLNALPGSSAFVCGEELEAPMEASNWRVDSDNFGISVA